MVNETTMKLHIQFTFLISFFLVKKSKILNNLKKDVERSREIFWRI